MGEKKIESLVEGGKASAGPPLGPALGPMGVNIKAVIDEINNKTKAYAGMKVPVTVFIDPVSKDFRIRVGSPPISALIMKELNLEKLSGRPNEAKYGNLSIGHVVKIAKMKSGSILAKDLKSATKVVLGTCISSGILVEGKDPHEVQKEIDEGKYDLENAQPRQLEQPDLEELKKIEAEGEKEEKPKEEAKK